MDPNSKAAALEQALQQQQGGQPPPEPSLMQRLMMLIQGKGKPWAENANAMLPEMVSGREAVLRKRAQLAELDAMTKGD
jgi:hypothetical protein